LSPQGLSQRTLRCVAGARIARYILGFGVSGLDEHGPQGPLRETLRRREKYDVVSAFVGGGGGKRDNEVYALIKLLEIKFKTTLGFPPKVCNSAGVYGCDSTDRVKLWMNFLQNHNLLKTSHQTPVSFGFEID